MKKNDPVLKAAEEVLARLEATAVLPCEYGCGRLTGVCREHRCHKRMRAEVEAGVRFICDTRLGGQ